MKYDILWVIVYVPKQRHLLPQPRTFPFLVFLSTLDLVGCQQQPYKNVFLGQKITMFFSFFVNRTSPNQLNEVNSLKLQNRLLEPWPRSPTTTWFVNSWTFWHIYVFLWRSHLWVLAMAGGKFIFGHLCDTDLNTSLAWIYICQHQKQNLWLDSHGKHPVDLGNERGQVFSTFMGIFHSDF